MKMVQDIILPHISILPTMQYDNSADALFNTANISTIAVN